MNLAQWSFSVGRMQVTHAGLRSRGKYVGYADCKYVMEDGILASIALLCRNACQISNQTAEYQDGLDVGCDQAIYVYT